MNLKSLFFALSLFALGTVTGAFFLRPAPSPEPSETLAREKLQLLADIDLKEYYRLKTMEEKFLKADEILGKIMVIFLADLGLRVSQNAQSAAQRPATIPAKIVVPEPAPARASPSPPREIAKDGDKKRKRDEYTLLHTRNEGSIESYLQRVKVESFDAALKTSRAFSNGGGLLPTLNGAFEGSAQVSPEGKRRQWHVRLELVGAMQKDELSGSLKITLSENGKVFSNSSSNGTITALREFPGESEALLTKVSDKDFFQLYYLKELDQLAGNIYRRDSEGSEFVHIGSTVLKRAQ